MHCRNLRYRISLRAPRNGLCEHCSEYSCFNRRTNTFCDWVPFDRAKSIARLHHQPMEFTMARSDGIWSDDNCQSIVCCFPLASRKEARYHYVKPKIPVSKQGFLVWKRVILFGLIAYFMASNVPKMVTSPTNKA